MKHLFGLFLLFCPLCILSFASCTDITGIVALTPGPRSTIFKGDKLEFNFTISPSIVLDDTEECRVDLMIGSTAQGSFNLHSKAVDDRINTTQVLSIDANPTLESHNFTWSIVVTGKNEYKVQSSYNEVCISNYPVAPTLAINSGVLTATLSSTGRGFCCDPSGVCETSLRFFYGPSDKIEESHFLGQVLLDDKSDSADMIIPSDIPSGDYHAFAFACSGNLCGPSDSKEFSIEKKSDLCKAVNFQFKNDDGSISWDWKSDDSGVACSKAYVFLSPELEGPYERFECDSTGKSFKPSGRYTYGAFYFYVVAGYNQQSTTSDIHQYFLQIASEPDPVELIWPANNSVFSSKDKKITLFYRSNSGGYINPGESPDIFYSVGGEKANQSAVVKLSDFSSGSIPIFVGNSFGNSTDTQFTFTICELEDFDSLSDLKPTASQSEVKVEWKSEAKFCDGLQGHYGFSVEIQGRDVSMLQWVGSQTSATFPNPGPGTFDVTVKLYGGNDTVTASSTAGLNISDSGSSSTCKSKTEVTNLNLERIKDANTYPHPVKLSWTASWVSQTSIDSCVWKRINIFVNNNLIATLPASEVSYTVNSSLLPESDEAEFTVVAVTESFSSSYSDRVKITDRTPIPFVKLVSPKHCNSSYESSVTFEWESLGGKNYTYEVFVGRDPKDMEIVNTTKENSFTSESGYFGTIYWTVRACDAEFCGGLSTPYTFYGCTGTTNEKADVRVTWSKPVVVKWNQTNFLQECPTDNSHSINSYFYFIEANKSDGTLNYSYSVLPSQSSVILNDLNEGEVVCIRVYKCRNEDRDNWLLAGEECDSVTGSEKPAITEGQINVPAIVSIGSTISWSVKWGRKCTEGTGCESRVWVKTDDSSTMIGVVASGKTGDTDIVDYSFELKDDSYLQTRDVSFIVAAYNGNSSQPSNSFVSKMCRPNTPSTPSLIFPTSMGSGDYFSNFSFSPLMDWGDCGFGAEHGRNYSLIFNAVGNQAKDRVKPFPANETTEFEDGGVGIYVDDLENSAIYKWTVMATNYFGLNSSSPSDYYYSACTVVPPDEPQWRGVWASAAYDFDSSSFVWDSSSGSFSPSSSVSTSLLSSMSSGTTSASTSVSASASASASTSTPEIVPLKVSPHGFTFEITDFYLGSEGVSCLQEPSDRSLCIRFGDEGKFDCHQDLYAVTDTSPLRIKPQEFFNTTAFNTSMMIYCFIVVDNKATTSLSKMLVLETFNRTCTDMNCTPEQGQCNQTTVLCDCFAGFSGAACEIDDVWKDTVKIIIGVSIGGFILLAAIATVVTILVVKFYRKHKALMMKPPDFEALRTPPMKMPSYGPDIDAPSDLSVLEAALLAPTGFQMIWDLLHHTSATEIDIMAKGLVYAYQKHNKGLELQLFLIMCEIAESQTSTVLFRANSPATRAFKFYSKMYALPYLYRTLAILLQSLIRDVDDMEEEKGGSGNGDDVQMPRLGDDSSGDNACSDENINTLKLQLTCQKFFIQILRSDKNCPGELKHICAFLRDQLQQRFPDFVYKGIGAFVFLRFYNTAITVPETYGLLPSAPRPSVRKQLLLVSKVLQNLANGVQFGEKEPNMEGMNSFLTSRRPSYEQFLSRLCDNSVPLSEPVPIADDSYRAALAVILNQFFIIMRSDPDYLSHLDCVPPDLAELIQNSIKKGKKKKEDSELSLLDPSEIPSSPAGADIPPPPVDQPTTTSTTTTTTTTL